MIQISQETADLLKASGKSRWYTPREETIVAKGKGKIRTFWLNIPTNSRLSFYNGSNEKKYTQERLSRMILWVTEVLMKIIKQIQAQHDARETTMKQSSARPTSVAEGQGRCTVLDEVCEVSICRPSVDTNPPTQMTSF